jgi:hypothetical protein
VTKEGSIAKATFGNHSSVLVPRRDRDSIRRFYGDVLGGTVTKADPEEDFVRVELTARPARAPALMTLSLMTADRALQGPPVESSASSISPFESR